MHLLEEMEIKGRYILMMQADDGTLTEADIQ